MTRARVAWLVVALAAGCGGGRSLSGAAGSSAAGQGGSSAMGGQGGRGDSGGPGGQTGTGGQGGDGGCGFLSDNDSTSCFNGVVMYQVFCPSSSRIVGTCPYGCMYAGAFGNVGLSLCNTPPDGGCDGTCGDAGGAGGTAGQGAGGQGGSPECHPGADDNVVTTCLNGVLMVSSHCPPSSSPAGTCPYGCMYGGQFGNFNVQGLCNPVPLDGGCDSLCSDASDGH